MFQTCVRNTLLFAFIAGPVGLAASFILAWVINQMKLRSLFAIAFYAPSITSGIAHVHRLAVHLFPQPLRPGQ